MKKYIYMAVAAIAALSSCSSDNDLLSGETGKKALTFTATMESDATRATYNSTEKCASWEAGDQISINGKTYNAQSAGLTTTFKAATKGQEATGDNYTAYFPATLYNNGTPTLPAAVTETWADGKFNMPMYATSSNTDLEFKNLCGVLKITVMKDRIAAVKSIKVSSANKAVSGVFTVNGSNAAVLTNAWDEANTLTVTYTDAVSTTEGDKVFYVAIPAQNYRELKIELSADGTNYTESMTTKSTGDITVERSKIYPITFVGPTTGSAAIKSGGTVNWVQLWAGGPRFAEKNVGANIATELGTKISFADATRTGDDYVWGAKWCTPSKANMDELLKATTYAGSTKVTCVYETVGGVWGFTFTGKEDGYTENSVFFPAEYGDGNEGYANYWSGTADDSNAWYLYLNCYYYYLNCAWDLHSQNYFNHLVRPVLK